MNNRSSTYDSPIATDDAGASLWQLVPLHDYKPPSEPAGETVRSTLHALWERLYARTQEEDAHAVDPDKSTLDAVPQGVLERIAPAPAWNGSPTAALDQALESWLDAEREKGGVQMLVAAPYSGMADMVIHWSRMHEYAVIKPPTPKQILENSEEWMSQWKQNEAPGLVFPWLERCYLRHHDGLDLVRRLLDWLWDAKRPCLLVSDSWAWCYLKRVHPLDAFPGYPLTLAALDAAALNGWLYRLANPDGPERFVFRQEDNGKRVIEQLSEDAHGNHQETQQNGEVSPYLRHLAARSRGIPGIAWGIWRSSLRIRAEEEVEQKVKAERQLTEQSATIWVTPWDDLDLPDVSTAINGDHSFILHTLLLHNGLSEELLPKLLPISPARALRALRYLQTHKLVAVGKNGWQVTPTAYPAVRTHLRTEGYMVDEL